MKCGAQIHKCGRTTKNVMAFRTKVTLQSSTYPGSSFTNLSTHCRTVKIGTAHEAWNKIEIQRCWMTMSKFFGFTSFLSCIKKITSKRCGMARPRPSKAAASLPTAQLTCGTADNVHFQPSPTDPETSAGPTKSPEDI